MHNRRNNDNIILFPKWQSTLEAESLQAIKEKKYTTALEKLNELICYQITNYEIFIGKLICLIELQRYDEAEFLCESLLKSQDENYYHYLHIYLTILFQTNQYSRLMHYVENDVTLDTIPVQIKEQFTQLYELSSKMKQDIDKKKNKDYEKELKIAFDQEDYQSQWRILETMRKINLNPPDELVGALYKKQVHPVIKTSIFNWLQDVNESRLIHIHKFGLDFQARPTDIPTIESHTMVKQTLLIFNELEQQNPSLYNILKQLFYRYSYVRYPILPPTEDIISVAEALKAVGYSYMDLHHNQQVKEEKKVFHYIEEINTFQTLYLSIIDD